MTLPFDITHLQKTTEPCSLGIVAFSLEKIHDSYQGINGHKFYASLYMMLLMWTNPLPGQVGGGWALETRFFGPLWNGIEPSGECHLGPASKALLPYRAVSIRGPQVVLYTWTPTGDFNRLLSGIVATPPPFPHLNRYRPVQWPVQ
jgi:hypothetical protein